MVKRDYHTDVGSELTYDEFHEETRHDVPHGNSFPASPSERDRYYRDDLNQEYYYNGTEWISTGFHADEHSIGGADPLKITYQIRFRLDNRITEPTPYTGKVGAPFYRTDTERVKIIVNTTESKELAYLEDCMFQYDSANVTTVTTTETTILEKTSIMAIKGKIFLNNLASGDRIIIRVYCMDQSGGTYRKEAEEYFEDAQTIPCKRIETTMGQWGVKVTLQKDAGTNRSVRWVFWRDR